MAEFEHDREIASQDTATSNSPKVEVSASIMCVDWLDAGRQLEILEREEIDYLHWDVVDGWFAPDFTMGSSIINTFRNRSRLRSDYHLMVEEPNRLFDQFEVSPGDIFTIHQECCRNLHRDLVSLRRKGARVGVALCPGTHFNALEYVIEDVDVILLMTVNPGFKGEKLVPQTIRKLEKLRQLVDDLKLDIKLAVDGNVSPQNVPDMVAGGADLLVGGSSGLFRADVDLVSSIHYLRDAIAQGAERRWGTL
jgi:ribulose-phosphate 3-epimerase